MSKKGFEWELVILLLVAAATLYMGLFYDM